MGLGIADGAVGGDVDLLATRHLDVLTEISKGQKLRRTAKGERRRSEQHTRPQKPPAQVQTVSCPGGHPTDCATKSGQ